MLIKLKPIMTETTMALAKKGWYTFGVPAIFRRPEIRETITKAFGVQILEIRTAIMKGKSKRSWRTRRVTKVFPWKKVMVKVKEGQKIELFEVGA